jgi:murein DD-endopeptidase MepM/ murein hydrolase activator NlpD
LARAVTALSVPVLLGGSALVVDGRALTAPSSASSSSAVGRVEVARALGERRARLGPAVRASRSRPLAVPLPVRVRPAAGIVTGPFGEWRGGHRHPGTDFDGRVGDPVLAAADGQVVLAGPSPPGFDGYGTIILLAHAGDVQTLYAHLSAVLVTPGQTVTAGERIGSIGTTGWVTGSHLHFEVHVHGQRVDPVPWLAGAGPV